jgi:hypothetical protein
MSFIDPVKKDNERAARRNLIEELFYDFHSSRRQVYLMNFFRGICFGLGVVVGSTILVAAMIWALNQFTGIFPAISDFTDQITDTLQKK